MTTITEIKERPRGAKIVLAQDCVLRFMEIVDSMDKGAVGHLIGHLRELGNEEPLNDHFVEAAITYARAGEIDG